MAILWYCIALLLLLEVMGRPSAMLKIKKQKRRKARLKSLRCEGKPAPDAPLELTSDKTLPDCVPGPSSEHSADIEGEMLASDTGEQTNRLTAIGDKDLELLEMAVYDSYRQEDEESYS